MAETRTPWIIKFIGQIQRICRNNLLRIMFEAYEKNWRDEMAREDYVREEAMTKGMEEGRKKGMEEGRAKGMVEGKIEGEQLFAELVKRLLADKRFDDIKLVSEDERARQRLYKEYGLEENG